MEGVNKIENDGEQSTSYDIIEEERMMYCLALPQCTLFTQLWYSTVEYERGFGMAMRFFSSLEIKPLMLLTEKLILSRRGGAGGYSGKVVTSSL